jgi:1,4-alpha-glucan branching enzyme
MEGERRMQPRTGPTPAPAIDPRPAAAPPAMASAATLPSKVKNAVVPPAEPKPGASRAVRRPPSPDLYFSHEAPLCGSYDRFGADALEVVGDRGESVSILPGSLLSDTDDDFGTSGTPVSRVGTSGRPRQRENTAAPGAVRAARTESLPPPCRMTDDDLFLFNEGTHYRLYDKLGAHPAMVHGESGVYFAVWAPDAAAVSVIGDFNGWNRESHPMSPRASSGVWERFIPGLAPGALYKFHVRSRMGGHRVDKADPLAFRAEVPPRTGSVAWDLSYRWGDSAWMATRQGADSHTSAVSIYEVHLGSWMRVPDEGFRSLTYREIAPKLAAYCKELGFTHVELMPIMEHPFSGSWGYQTTGYFAPTSRFGTPQDFMFLVDTLHQAGIGVILDWVPSHFPTDEHGPAYFDGTHLYEHADPRLGFHPDWKSAIFNYSRKEVRCFLLSSAMYWLDKFHVDGLRVDAVASMLYLDYSRKEGEWIPNEHGGRDNVAAVSFLRQLNEAVYANHPGVQTYAEESTAWPMVSRPTSMGGLGFGFKWDMGWMHDSLRYLAREPVYRKHHQNELTFRALYAFTENYVLALSHDEVVHGKGSLVRRMPGDDWQKFANVRLLMGWMFGQPGKKLLFMGCELAQWDEWNADGSLDWHLTAWEPHRGMQRLVSRLNELYKAEPALHERDCDPAGFEWVDTADHEQSVLSFLRKATDGKGSILAVYNFTPVPRTGYRLGVPVGGRWRELLSSDATEFGGSGFKSNGLLTADAIASHGRGASLALNLPPLGVFFLKSEA